jgi:hypothetical protein
MRHIRWARRTDVLTVAAFAFLATVAVVLSTVQAASANPPPAPRRPSAAPGPGIAASARPTAQPAPPHPSHPSHPSHPVPPRPTGSTGPSSPVGGGTGWTPRYLIVDHAPAPCDVHVVVGFVAAPPLSLCWHPACVMTLRDGPQPTVDCPPVVTDPHPAPRADALRVFYDPIAPYCVNAGTPTVTILEPGGGPPITCADIRGCEAEFRFARDPLRVSLWGVVCGKKLLKPRFPRPAVKAPKVPPRIGAHVLGVKLYLPTLTPAPALSPYITPIADHIRPDDPGLGLALPASERSTSRLVVLLAGALALVAGGFGGARYARPPGTHARH